LKVKIKRSGSASWAGSLKEGKGVLSTQSGALSEQPYGFGTRFENVPGTNPEELIAAAHAGCFTMALSNLLGQNGFTAERLDTTAVVTLERGETGFSIPAVSLTLAAKISGIDDASFRKLAAEAKANCPVSKLLKADVTLDAKLV
jgi:osmotically inducible protein OsmC